MRAGVAVSVVVMVRVCFVGVGKGESEAERESNGGGGGNRTPPSSSPSAAGPAPPAAIRSWKAASRRGCALWKATERTPSCCCSDGATVHDGAPPPLVITPSPCEAASACSRACRSSICCGGAAPAVR